MCVSCGISRLTAAAASLSVVLNLQPVEGRGLPRTTTSYKRVSTFCNRKCDHGVQPGNGCEKGKKMLWGLKCHVNSWVQPVNTSGVLSTPFNAFKGQGFVWTGLCSYSPWCCKRPQFPATTREGLNLWKEIKAVDCREELLSLTGNTRAMQSSPDREGRVMGEISSCSLLSCSSPKRSH